MDVFAMIESLWRLAQDLELADDHKSDWKVQVRCDHWGLAWRDMAGEFVPPEMPGYAPQVLLRRDFFVEPGEQPSRERSPNAPTDLPPIDLLEELITLSHEIGHLLSWNGRTDPEQYRRYQAAAQRRHEVWTQATEASPEDKSEWELRRASSRLLTDEERSAIIEEETLAWNIGRQLLAERGFSDWPRFDQRVLNGVARHRYLLALTDDEPGGRLESE